MSKKNGPKGKLPAMMFYVKDWLGDPNLQMASPSTRGIWANMLCYMWMAKDKGSLEGTLQQYEKLGGASPSEIQLFMKEARSLDFCDISQESPGIVTVTNRRMSQEEAVKRGARLRKRSQRDRHRENEPVPPDVTPLVTEKSHPPLSDAVSVSSHSVTLDSSEEHSSEPVLLSILLIKRDGEFDVMQDDVDEWEDVFPGINVLSCLKFIKTWNKDNPKKRKTASGVRKHITTWLAKEQNLGARSTYFKHEDPDQKGKFTQKHKLPDGENCGECKYFGGCGTGYGSGVCVRQFMSFLKRPDKFE